VTAVLGVSLIISRTSPAPSQPGEGCIEQRGADVQVGDGPTGGSAEASIVSERPGGNRLGWVRYVCTYIHTYIHTISLGEAGHRQERAEASNQSMMGCSGEAIALNTRRSEARDLKDSLSP
jgi:hypothetical protein